jgi:hypothetical protein
MDFQWQALGSAFHERRCVQIVKHEKDGDKPEQTIRGK